MNAGVPRYRTFSHTADLGLEVEASSLPALFTGFVTALLCESLEGYGPIGESVAASTGGDAAWEAVQRGGEERDLSLAAPSYEELLVDFLNEVLAMLQIDRVIPRTCTVALDPDGEERGRDGTPQRVSPDVGEPRLKLTCRFQLVPLRPSLRLIREIKAATYHAARVEPLDSNNGESSEKAKSPQVTWRGRIIFDV